MAVSLHLEGVNREGVYTMVGGPAFSLQFCLVAMSLHLEGVISEGVHSCTYCSEQIRFLVCNSDCRWPCRCT